MATAVAVGEVVVLVVEAVAAAVAQAVVANYDTVESLTKGLGRDGLCAGNSQTEVDGKSDGAYTDWLSYRPATAKC